MQLKRTVPRRRCARLRRRRQARVRDHPVRARLEPGGSAIQDGARRAGRDPDAGKRAGGRVRAELARFGRVRRRLRGACRHRHSGRSARRARNDAARVHRAPASRPRWRRRRASWSSSRAPPELIAQRLGHARWQLAYQSRSVRPQDPWLEPTSIVVVEQLAAAGERRVVVAPIGFVLRPRRGAGTISTTRRRRRPRAAASR